MSGQENPQNRRIPTAQRGGQRKHMGTATSDPDYLTPTGFEHNGRQALDAYANAKRARGNGGLRMAEGTGKGKGKPGQLHYDRYLSTPKPGRAIFTSQHDRRRKQVKTILAVLIVLAIALALVWFFFLR